MEVAVLGALNIDILGTANVPFSSASSLPGTIKTALGGTGWNAARACALLGLETDFISILAKDGYETAIRRQAQGFGVDLERCRWDEGQNGCFLSVFDADGKRLASVNDMNFSRRMDVFFCEAAARALPEDAVAVADCDLQADALAKFCERLPDAPLVVNCVSASKCMRVQNILPRIHTLLLGRTEAERLTGYAGPERCATALLKLGLARVCVTMGAEGVLLADREEMRRLSETDARGAGADAALTAALAASLARGMDTDKTAKLLTAASAVAALSRETVNPELSRLKPYI